MNTFVIQTLGGKDAVLEAGRVVVSLLNVHVVVTFVVGYSKNMFDSLMKFLYKKNPVLDRTQGKPRACRSPCSWRQH